MFGELFDDLRQSINEMRHGTVTQTLTVAKPFCSPARDTVMTALEPYGVKVYGYSEMVHPIALRSFLRRMKIELRTWENLRYGPAAPAFLPSAIVVKVTVSEKAAAWAEYLMLRTGKLYVQGTYVNKRNEQWASQHGGQMPPRWERDQPWIEKSCGEGSQAWQPVKQAMNEYQNASNGYPSPFNGRQIGRKLTKAKGGKKR